MKRKSFATIAGISAAMVSKYEAGGAIVIVDGEVEPYESLARLAGRLNDAKWEKANTQLEALRRLHPTIFPICDPGGAERPATSRQQRAAIELDLKRRESAERAAGLVLASEVADGFDDAAAKLKDLFDREAPAIAAEICREFDLKVSDAESVAEILQGAFTRSLAAFRLAAMAWRPSPPHRAAVRP